MSPPSCLECREAGRQAWGAGSSTARPAALSTAKQQPELQTQLSHGHWPLGDMVLQRPCVHSRPGLPAPGAGGPGSGSVLGVAVLTDDASSRQGLAEYCTLIDSSSSFRAYRAALSEVEPPCIPYL